MSSRSLGGIILVLFIALAVVVISSEQGVSRIIEKLGDHISRFLGY